MTNRRETWKTKIWEGEHNRKKDSEREREKSERKVFLYFKNTGYTVRIT